MPSQTSHPECSRPDQSKGKLEPGRVMQLEAQIAGLRELIERTTFQHPSDSELVELGRSLAHNMTGTGFLFQTTDDLIRFCRELLSEISYSQMVPIELRPVAF